MDVTLANGTVLHGHPLGQVQWSWNQMIGFTEAETGLPNGTWVTFTDLSISSSEKRQGKPTIWEALKRRLVGPLEPSPPDGQDGHYQDWIIQIESGPNNQHWVNTQTQPSSSGGAPWCDNGAWKNTYSVTPV